MKTNDELDSQVMVENEEDDQNLPALTDDSYDLGENPLIGVIEKAITLPGVKVNRTTFLMEAYNLSAIEADGVEFFQDLSIETMDKVASSIIAKNVTASSSAAFLLGLPGGFAMAASIPADVMQNFAFSLRLAQQIAYTYGFSDLFESDELSETSRNTLILFLGIMFMATGSGTVLRAISPNVGKYAAKQILSKPLTKTVWYPTLKQITKVVSSKTLTKSSLSGFATKAIPIVGGVASAGINTATMIPMANRLKNELRKYHLPEEEIVELIEEDRASFGDKASDFISDVAAGTVKAAESTRNMGKKMGKFMKDIETKTRMKIEKDKK